MYQKKLERTSFQNEKLFCLVFIKKKATWNMLVRVNSQDVVHHAFCCALSHLCIA